MKNNTKLRNVYLSMLEFIQKRFKNDNKHTPSEVERRFIDILKIIIEGGYTITEKDYEEILDSIWEPTELTKDEIEFFNMFVNLSKPRHTHSSFEH